MIPFAQGVGFAIPTHAVKRVVEQILRNGRVVRPFLGISGVDVDSAIARRFNLAVDSGVLLAEVGRDTPAYEGGLRSGDIMVRVAEQEVKQMRDLLLALSGVSVGDVLAIHFIRGGRGYETSVRLVESPYGIVRRSGGE